MNLRDFIAWRGDLTFDMIPFNHIDAAIFSELSMIDLDDFLIENDKNVKMTIKDPAQGSDDLPATGGTGRVIIYVIGSLLLIGGATGYVASRRKYMV